MLEARPGTPVFPSHTDFFSSLGYVSAFCLCAVMFSLNRTNSLGWDATLKKQKLMMTASASASQFLLLKVVFRVALGGNVLGMQTGVPLGTQSGGN